jgi:Putative peptidoglycan binding domain
MRTGDWHVVKQGESIATLAAATGHLADAIWKAPENDELRRKRADPAVLMPGDRVFIPEKKQKTVTVKTGAAQKFEATVPKPPLRVRLEVGGVRQASKPYVLTVDGKELRGTTDGTGLVEQKVPIHARTAALRIGEGNDALVWMLDLHGLDPVNETSGVQERLRNLGYDPGPVDGVLSERTRAAIAAFQKDAGVEATGEPDAATQQKLKDAHGS